MKNKDMFEEFMEEVEKDYKELCGNNLRDLAKIIEGHGFDEECAFHYLLGMWKAYKNMFDFGWDLKNNKNKE